MIRTGHTVAHHFTVDVEEYFQVSALEPYVARADWNNFERRVVKSTLHLSAMLASQQIRATFFVLGWVAEREPSLIRELAATGHEIASHGWDHRRVTQQTPAEFRDSVRRTKQLLEELTATEVLGFRAPSFSIVPGREWALDILIEEGYRYDSSLFPVARRGYGYANGARDPHRLQRAAGSLIEMPPATLRRMGVNFPAAGGAYLRLLPPKLVKAALLEYERRGVPATFYIHPWELDPEQPRLTSSLATRLRHYGGLARMSERVQSLIEEFRFQPIRDSLSSPSLAAV